MQKNGAVSENISNKNQKKTEALDHHFTYILLCCAALVHLNLTCSPGQTGCTAAWVVYRVGERLLRRTPQELREPKRRRGQSSLSWAANLAQMSNLGSARSGASNTAPLWDSPRNEQVLTAR